MEYEQVEAHNISMYPADWETVRKVAGKNRVKLSTALRMIVHHFEECQEIRHDPETQQQTVTASAM